MGAISRVLDAEGRPVPFQLMFHDGDRYALIAFRAADPAGRPSSTSATRRPAGPPSSSRTDPAPGSGPPQGDWIPRSGLVLTTLRRPEGENPKTVAEMAALIAASPAKFGARYQRRVADGFNPFGPSDNYISLYRGWIDIPRAGAYQFCTVSNEASFSFLDGKELVHWPGGTRSNEGSAGRSTRRSS
jgi:hypothetical protein